LAASRYHHTACSRFCSTTSPFSYIRPRLTWASACRCAAALRKSASAIHLFSGPPSRRGSRRRGGTGPAPTPAAHPRASPARARSAPSPPSRLAPRTPRGGQLLRGSRRCVGVKRHTGTVPAPWVWGGVPRFVAGGAGSSLRAAERHAGSRRRAEGRRGVLAKSSHFTGAGGAHTGSRRRHRAGGARASSGGRGLDHRKPTERGWGVFRVREATRGCEGARSVPVHTTSDAAGRLSGAGERGGASS